MEYIGVLFTLLPVIVVAFIIRWVRLIKVNSDIQIEQNKEIIALLKREKDVALDPER